MIEDEDFLLELLNTTPHIDGVQRDLLTGTEGRTWLRSRGGAGSVAEREAVRGARDALQAVVRGDGEVATLRPLLDGVRSVPSFDGEDLVWSTEAPAHRLLVARAMLAWDAVRRERPGRLRPCENHECSLFFVDHSKPNRARWCSMASCGNRMKARRHYERTRGC